MKLNLFKSRKNELSMISYGGEEITNVFTFDYGTPNFIHETYYNDLNSMDRLDKLFMVCSMHSPIYLNVKSLTKNPKPKPQIYSWVQNLRFTTSSDDIRPSVFIPVIAVIDKDIKWKVKYSEKSETKDNPFTITGNHPIYFSEIGTFSASTTTSTSSTTLKQALSQKENVYRIKEIIVNTELPSLSTNISVVSRKTYEAFKEPQPGYEILGVWNFITNDFYAFYNTQEEREITEIVFDCLKKDGLNNLVKKIFSSGYEFTLGYEEEFLFMEKENVIPATRVFVESLDKVYQGLPPSEKEYLVSRGRDVLNTIFNRTGIGTDGRRILGEIRGTFYTCNGRNEQQTFHAVQRLWSAIESSYLELYKTGYNIRIGGGIQGETIGTHIHFNVQQDSNFVILLNKIFGKKLQEMQGGQRPSRINPADRFTTDDSLRANNTYGQINNDIYAIRNDFQNAHGVQVRTKSNDEAKWWEWRIPPACFINKTYTINLLMSIWELINLSSKNFDFPDVNLTINNKILFDIFQKSKYFWEWYFMSNSLWLTTSPFKYTIFNEVEKLVFNSNFLMLKTSKKESFIKDPENFDLEQLRFAMKDYINPSKKYIFKYERNKENTICVHQDKKVSLEFWINHLNLKITPIYKCEKDYRNSHFICGFFTTEEIYQLTKICLLIN